MAMECMHTSIGTHELDLLVCLWKRECYLWL